MCACVRASVRLCLCACVCACVPACVRFSLASQPYFFLVRMRVREGGGGKEGKIRLVTYARFSFPIGMQLLFKR